MSEDETEKEAKGEQAIVVKLPLKGELSLSQKAFDKFANAIPWLFPGRDARGTVTRAMAERVADLIRGDATPSSPLDQLLLEQALRTQLSRESAVLRTVERAGELHDGGYHLSPDRALPPGSSNATRATAPEWFARWRRETEDVTSEEIRNLYARLLAGELESPTAFSMRTLSVVRDLDQRVAQLFAALEPFTFAGGVYFPALKQFVKLSGMIEISPAEMAALRDAGIVTSADDAVMPLNLRQMGSLHNFAAEMWVGHEWFRFRFTYRSSPRPRDAFLPVESFTRAGHELLRILPPADRAARMPVLRWIAEHIAGEAHCPLEEIDVRAFPHEARGLDQPNDGERVSFA
jgi:hypothetical protein